MNNTERTKILSTLHEVRDLIDGYIDIKDGLAGQPVANDAMQAAQLIDELLVEVSSPRAFPEGCVGRLERLSDARSTLRNPGSFDAILLGALSTRVDDEEWASCLRCALNGAMQQEKVLA